MFSRERLKFSLNSLAFQLKRQVSCSEFRWLIEEIIHEGIQAGREMVAGAFEGSLEVREPFLTEEVFK
ncbi:MAG: hypothetical protein ACE5LX_09280, partial [Nitrospinota bacterium]